MWGGIPQEPAPMMLVAERPTCELQPTANESIPGKLCVGDGSAMGVVVPSSLRFLDRIRCIGRYPSRGLSLQVGEYHQTLGGKIVRGIWNICREPLALAF